MGRNRTEARTHSHVGMRHGGTPAWAWNRVDERKTSRPTMAYRNSATTHSSAVPFVAAVAPAMT